MLLAKALAVGEATTLYSRSTICYMNTASAHVATSKHSMSEMWPLRSSRQRARTLVPRSTSPSTACSIVVSAPSILIRAQANGLSARGYLRRCLGHPRPVGDRAGVGELDDRVGAQAFTGLGVVFERRTDHSAVACADADDLAVAQSGQEGADDRPDAPSIRKLELPGGLSHDGAEVEHVSIWAATAREA